MMQEGFTFLEVLIALSIMAILALFAMPQYQGFLSQHQARVEASQLSRMITFARQQAILRNDMITLCPYDLGKVCGEDWSLGLLVLDNNNQMISEFLFENDAQVFLKTFPMGHEYVLQFSRSGDTKAQNGSFYYCPTDGLNATRIVFNQAGRVYVTIERAVEGCRS